MLLSRRATERDFNPRRGITLAEVLIALFVLAIGMLGILALFPLGATQMAQAIKDERSAQLADIGEGHMRILWRMAWLNPNTGALNAPATVQATYSEYASLNLLSTSSGPSTPVYLDPIGYGNLGNSVANVLPRATCSNGVTATLTQKLRLFALMDDLTFAPTGQAATPISRGDRYTAAFLLQLPKNNVPQEVNLKVVVYQGRSIDNASAETVVGTPAVTPGSDSISINTSGIPLRLGTWILLAGSSPEPFADFYRVVGYTPNQVSVSPQVRMHGSVNGSYSGTAVILSDVVEVFDRGTVTPFEVAGH